MYALSGWDVTGDARPPDSSDNCQMDSLKYIVAVA